MYTRRDVSRFALGGLAIRAFGAGADSASGGIRLGATTWSLRDLPRVPGQDNIDDLIKPLKSAGITEINLWSYNAEPAGPNTGPGAPPPPAAYPIKIHKFTKEEIDAAMLQARNLTRDWRLSTPPEHFAEIRGRFAAAGISVSSFTVGYDETFSDPETDTTFLQAKALGASSITAPGKSETVARLAPFAAKHQMNVSVTDFALANQLPSSRFKVNVDIGAITAANGSPVAFIQENHDLIGQITVKDRRRNKGENEQFGDGDTPIADVLRLVKEKRYSFPVFAEYEYLGLGTPAEELGRCMDYMRSAIG